MRKLSKVAVEREDKKRSSRGNKVSKSHQSQSRRKSNIILDSDSNSDSSVNVSGANQESGLEDTDDDAMEFHSTKCKTTKQKKSESKQKAKSKQVSKAKPVFTLDDEDSDVESSGSEASWDDADYKPKIQNDVDDEYSEEDCSASEVSDLSGDEKVVVYKKKKRKVAVEDEYEEESSGSGSETGEDAEYGGPELYWRLDAEMDRERELNNSGGRNMFDVDSDVSEDSNMLLNTSINATPMITKSMSLSEAFMKYIEMLALYHLDPNFNDFMQNTRTTPGSGRGRLTYGSNSQSQSQRTPSKFNKSPQKKSNFNTQSGSPRSNTEGMNELTHYYSQLVNNPMNAVHPLDEENNLESGQASGPGLLYKDYKNPSCHNAYHLATKQIEGVLCTYRESAMGSSAWGYGEFVQSLQSRPFSYAIKNISHSEDSFYKCDACRRSTHKGVRYQVYFYGTAYECKTSWSSRNWPNYMPVGLLIHQSMDLIAETAHGAEADSDSDSEKEPIVTHKMKHTNRKRANSYYSDSNSDSDSASDVDPLESYANSLNLKHSASDRKSLLELWTPTWFNSNASSMRTREDQWVMGTTCHCRSGLYHTLLHYKLRLLMKVRGKLIGYNYDIKRLMLDTRFIMDELQRYEGLIHQAKVFNIKGVVDERNSSMHMNIQEDIWENSGDVEDGGNGEIGSGIGIGSGMNENTPRKQESESVATQSSSNHKSKNNNNKNSVRSRNSGSNKVQKTLHYKSSNNSLTTGGTISDSDSSDGNEFFNRRDAYYKPKSSTTGVLDLDDIEDDEIPLTSNSGGGRRNRNRIQPLKQSQLKFNIQKHTPNTYESNTNTTSLDTPSNNNRHIIQPYRSHSKNGKMVSKNSPY